MPRCIVVPGFLASTIYSLDPARLLLWVNVPRLLVGQIGLLRLAPNGVDPQPPDGGPCESGEGLGTFVEEPAVQLGIQLAAAGYAVETWGYDWRKELHDHGSRLAVRIRQVATIADPCSLVCHSTGGLVGRAAWSRLSETGDTGLVRRIVTLGTPHEGTYASVKVFSKEDNLIRQLVFFSQLLAFTPVGRLPFFQMWQPGQVRALAETWPALYCLMPAMPAPASDPNRGVMFTSGNWTGGAAPQQQWLTYAQDVWWPLMKSAGSMPPSWVLTTVAGTGWWTRNRLDDPSRLGDPDALGGTYDGDGVVPEESAIVTNAAVFRVSVAHDDMLVHLVRSGQVAQWVLDVRTAPSPTPPAVTVLGADPPEFQAPPITDLGFPGVNNSPCLTGRCGC